MGELNLIPYDLKEKRSNKLKQIKYGLIGAGILIVLIIAMAIPRFELFMLQKQQNTLEFEISSGNSVLAENKKIILQIQNINQYVNKVEQLSKQRVIVGSRSKGIGKYMPGDISLQRLEYSTGIITITGSTKNYNSISELVTNMQMSEEYSQAVITNINYDKQHDMYTFSVTID
jgi:Tfp pilus assembly protein PilN